MSIEIVRSKVQDILTEHVGTIRLGREGVFILERDSAVVFVRVKPLSEKDCVVKIYSPMLRDVSLTSEVFRWVAIEGQQRWFAHARVNVSDDDPEKGEIGWEYDLLGNTIDPDELMRAVAAVALGADKYDDELRDRFGGRRWIDD